MKKQTLFTIGEIYRLGLLKTAEGEPYKTIISVSVLINKQKYHNKLTKYGMAKCLDNYQIEKLNNRWK